MVLDPAMGLERANHCIATAKPSAWVLPAASWFTYLKVCLFMLVVSIWPVQLQRAFASHLGEAVWIVGW